jgi:hypothetical protein
MSTAFVSRLVAATAAETLAELLAKAVLTAESIREDESNVGT